jgi:HD-like signal output (HDOD) protein
MADVRAKIAQSTRLITLPEVYFRVSELLRERSTTSHDLAAAISLDPALTARLLKVANSAWYGQAGRVGTVQRAVMLVGTRQIYDLVLATAIATAFAGREFGDLDVRKFWLNSSYSAAAARLLATACNVLDVERIFVEGLLRDIGHMVLYQAEPELSLKARKRAEAGGGTLAEAEQRLLGIDFAEVGGELLRAWRVPDSLQRAVRFQLAPQQAGDALLEACIMNLIGVMTDAHAAGLRVDAGLDRVANITWQVTRVSPGKLAEVHRQAAGEAVTVHELLFGDLKAG